MASMVCLEEDGEVREEGRDLSGWWRRRARR